MANKESSIAYENLNRWIFPGVGEYGIPRLEAETFDGNCEFVGFNYARGNCRNPEKKAVHFLCSLNVGDIDLYKQEFKVMGKGRKERRLYISDGACFHLYRYLRWRMSKEGLTMEELASKPLFVSAKKPYSRMTVAGVQYLVKNLGKKAGVGNVHPHRFRRTFATDLLNRGMRIEEVMVLMGHTKIETTLIYCNIKQDNVRESYRKYAA